MCTVDGIAPYKLLVRVTLEDPKAIQAIVTSMGSHRSSSEVDDKTQLLRGLHFLDAGYRDTKLDLDWTPPLC